jgi:hypothetical protein
MSAPAAVQQRGGNLAAAGAGSMPFGAAYNSVGPERKMEMEARGGNP